jgi:hypothetical protein
MQVEGLQEQDVGDGFIERVPVAERNRIQCERTVGAHEDDLAHFDHHEQRQHHHVQRPEPGEPHRHEADAIAGMVEALAIRMTEHEARQGKEYVDAELQVHKWLGALQRMVNGDVEEHHEQRADAAHCIKCLKSTRVRRCPSAMIRLFRRPLVWNVLEQGGDQRWWRSGLLRGVL